MMTRRVIITAIASGALAAAPRAGAAQQFTRRAPITAVSTPIILDTTGLFLERAARVGEDMFVTGQPTERALRELREQVVTTVVNLRTPEEMTRNVKFDEAALVASLGMQYVYLPVRGNDQYPYSPATLAKFAAAVSNAKGKVLVHCTVAWRASHLWAAYLIDRGIPVDSALANARAINLMDEHRMGSNGRQPAEDFLYKSLPTLGHPPR